MRVTAYRGRGTAGEVGSIQKKASPESLADGPGATDIEEENNTPLRPSTSSKSGSAPRQHQESGLTEHSPLAPTLGREDQSPTFSMVFLLVIFFVLYVGAEIGFGTWVVVIVLREGLAGEALAASMARWGYPT